MQSTTLGAFGSLSSSIRFSTSTSNPARSTRRRPTTDNYPLPKIRAFKPFFSLGGEYSSLSTPQSSDSVWLYGTKKAPLFLHNKKE